MKLLFSLFIYLFVSSLYSQSFFNKTIDASFIKDITIILDHAFEIKIISSKTNTINIRAINEGEYQNSLFIKTTLQDQNLSIVDGFQPFSKFFNDKLSAHKVFSLKIEINIPVNLNVTLKSTSASAYFSGDYQSIFSELTSGNCSLNPFTGNAKIHTLNGNITIHTKDATVTASNIYGKIPTNLLYGRHKIELKTIHGHINTYKIK